MEPLRESQVADLAWMMQQEKGLLLHDPGVGKTPPVCTYMYFQMTERQSGSVWIMPKSLLRKNAAELLRFSEFEPDHIQIVDGTPDERAQQMYKPAAVYLMGAKRFAQDWVKLKTYQPHLSTIMIDELHLMYPTWGSQQTQELYKATRTKSFQFLFGMTGSLIKGRLDSAFPFIHMIEPRYYGSELGFKAQHAVTDPYGSVIGWQNHGKLAKILGLHGIRRTFADEYGPEAKIIQVRDLELTPPHQAIYRQWHEQAMIELEDKFLESPNAAVNALRARQILGCPEDLLIPSLMRHETARDAYIATELEDIKHRKERYVIFSCFVPEINRLDRLANKVGLRSTVLSGEIESSKRAEREAAFRNNELDVLVVNPLVAGIGYNWPFLDRMCFASLGYEDDSFIQAYRRGIRGKRTTPLLVSIFGYRNTIDWRVRQIIEIKSHHSNLVDSTYEILELNKAATK